MLDIGGGTGGFAVRVAELGARVTVVDPSPDALAALARRAASSPSTSPAHQGDLSTLLEVTGPDSADLVLCHGVLEVVDDPAAALATLRQVLRPGGVLSLLVAQRHAAVVARAMAGHFAQASTLLDAGPGERDASREPSVHRRRGDRAGDRAGFAVESVHGGAGVRRPGARARCSTSSPAPPRRWSSSSGPSPSARSTCRWPPSCTCSPAERARRYAGDGHGSVTNFPLLATGMPSRCLDLLSPEKIMSGDDPWGGTVPLSEEELRLLEQMERALVEEDPKFASTLRGTAFRRSARRRAIFAGVCFAVGVAVLMTGAVARITALGIAGFVVMLVSATVALAAMRGQHGSAAADPARQPPQPRRLHRHRRWSPYQALPRSPARTTPSWTGWNERWAVAATPAGSDRPALTTRASGPAERLGRVALAIGRQ